MLNPRRFWQVSTFQAHYSCFISQSQSSDFFFLFFFSLVKVTLHQATYCLHQQESRPGRQKNMFSVFDSHKEPLADCAAKTDGPPRPNLTPSPSSYLVWVLADIWPRRSGLPFPGLFADTSATDRATVQLSHYYTCHWQMLPIALDDSFFFFPAPISLTGFDIVFFCTGVARLYFNDCLAQVAGSQSVSHPKPHAWC